jgi:class 3 adenylate cyclase
MHIAGDSFFATFRHPQRAVDCARALAPALRTLGVPSRFGLHWGACEMRGEGVSGLAVWAAARVMAAAEPDEIVVSDAMRETPGDAVPVQDRGVHTLKAYLASGVCTRSQLRTRFDLSTSRPRRPISN